MASLNSAINVQVDSQDKEMATSILKDLGLNMSTAINMFVKQIIKTNGLPFEVVNPTPSRELKKALKEGERILNGKSNSKGYHDIKQMVEDILNED